MMPRTSSSTYSNAKLAQYRCSFCRDPGSKAVTVHFLARNSALVLKHL